MGKHLAICWNICESRATHCIIEKMKDTMSDNVSGADNQQGSLRLLADDPSETTCRIPQMNRELAILLALLFTDGCVSPKRKQSWRIYFSNMSPTLVELFRSCMLRVFYLNPLRIRIRKNSSEMVIGVVDSKEIGNYLIEKFGTFRTLRFKNGKFPATKLPIEELVKSKYTPDFLKVAFSCDGGLCFYPARRKGARGGTIWLIRTVFLTCIHPQLRRDYTKLLNFEGIKTREVARDGKIKIEREEDIRKFYEKVGFINGVEATKHSKFWKGQEKQKILEHMIFSYGNPSNTYNLPIFNLR
ncbi:MAG: hypothetical protein HYV78_00240 [Candidatus Wildermuthbacteria bacterium]|nr:hypothetical protein [Candidatus Wildermuthbacteria bacterium]